MDPYVVLLKACKEGNHKKVKKLLGQLSDIGDVRDLTDKTLLHYCFKNQSCTDLILDAAPDLLNIGEKNGYTVLHLASMIKPPISLNHLLSKHPDVNKLNNDSRTALLLAVIYNNSEAVKILCEHSADVNISDNSKGSPLHYAAKVKAEKAEEETQIIEVLLEYNANIESLDFHERSPLMWAVCSNNIVKMKYLLEKGADIYTKDAEGLSILHYAISMGNEELVKILLDDYGFCIETSDNNLCTALMYASSYSNPTVLITLLEKGANVDAVDSKGRNVAHFASGKGDLKNLEILNQYKADLWKLNNESNYPLHEAAYKGHPQVLQFLIDNISSNEISKELINHKNQNGQTALHLGAVKDNLSICSILLENAADTNILLRTSNGKSMTALDLANKNETKFLITKFDGKLAEDLLKTLVIQEEEVLEKLSESNGDDGTLSTTSDDQVAKNEDIMEYEKETMENEVLEEIFESNEIESENKESNFEVTEEYKKDLLLSCYNGSMDGILEFIEKGGSLSEIEDQTGKTLLHYSLKNTQIFQMIIDKAPDLVNKHDNQNLIVLHMVIMLKEMNLLKILIKNDSDFNFSDSSGRTALHLAVLYNNLEALQIMYDHVEDKSRFIHKPDAEGNYPLHYIVEVSKIKKVVYHCKEFLELLLKMNGDIECKDKVNRTPLLLGINIQNIEAVLVLLKLGANVMAKDNQNLCSLHYVCSEGSLEIFNELAAMEMFEPDVEDPNGLTPIFYAISSCNEKLVKRLIELNARLDVIDNIGRNVCHKSAEKGAFKCLELLLSYNVNPWLKSNDGSMPLHEAAYRGYKEIAEILLNTAGAKENINVKNNSGQTALHLAAVRNDCPMCFLLISKGSNINEILYNVHDDESLTAYDLATTPYCKETLYTFGGRSAKRIIDSLSLENDFEDDRNLEDLTLLRKQNMFFSHRQSIRSTELALSTLPSVINTVRTGDISIDPKSSVAQQKTNSKPSSKKSDNSNKKCLSSSERSFLGSTVNETILSSPHSGNENEVHDSDKNTVNVNKTVLNDNNNDNNTNDNNNNDNDNNNHGDNNNDNKINNNKDDESNNFNNDHSIDDSKDDDKININNINDNTSKSINDNNVTNNDKETVNFPVVNEGNENDAVSRSNTFSAKISIHSSQNSETSEIGNSSNYIPNQSNTTSRRRNKSRTKSIRIANRINPVSINRKKEVQSSVLRYEYNRINGKIGIDIIRQKIREENIGKLINPQTPNVLRNPKLKKLQNASS